MKHARKAGALKDSTVFLVDDDPRVRKALSRWLRSVGLDVQVFPSAPDFLSGTYPDRTSCLVVDVRLPGLSGLDLQEALSRANVEIPIIFITGHGDVPTSVRAMKGGAVDFLEKPLKDEALLKAIQNALTRDRSVRLERAQRKAVLARFETLTPREREVFALVVKGLLNKQIGAELGTSEKTIKVHRARVMTKMQAGSVPELVRLSERLGPPRSASTPSAIRPRSN